MVVYEKSNKQMLADLRPQYMTNLVKQNLGPNSRTPDCLDRPSMGPLQI